MFYPDEYETIPRVIVDVMAALGAWRVSTAAACGSHDYCECREVHYLWPEGHPVEELLEKDGRYEVRSASGNWYEVDVISESCTCPDWRKHPRGGCKHLRRVDHEIKQGRIPRSDGRLPSKS